MVNGKSQGVTGSNFYQPFTSLTIYLLEKLCQIQNDDIQKLAAENAEHTMRCELRRQLFVRIVRSRECNIVFARSVATIKAAKWCR